MQETPASSEPIALFELEAPSVARFMMHGTLPVPPGTFPRADGKSPFQVIDSDGQLVPAQTEIVSRYPADWDGADVVEVLAQVERPAGAAPGARLTYAVVLAPHAQPAFQAEANVRELLTTPGAIVLRAHDVFHNPYEADLAADLNALGPNSARILRNGSRALQIATHEVLTPTNPDVPRAQGTLLHLMGVHSYITQWSRERFISLDLRIHNAMSGLDDDDPLDDPVGKLYFESLELRLPPGWIVLNSARDPYFGEPYDEDGWRVWPIVSPLADGKMHLLPPMAQFERRLVIAIDGAEQRARASLHEEGLAFCRAGWAPSGTEYYSWWNALTARYFPQRQRLPNLDHVGLESLRAADAAAYWRRLRQVATGGPGIWPATSPGLGWAHPWGVPDGGMVSGEEIYLIDGVTTACAASRAGYRLTQLAHRMYTDRQSNVLFNADGRPTQVDQWVVHASNGSYLPVWWYNAPMLWATDPFGFGRAPRFQVNAVALVDLEPDYEADLLEYDPIDEAHLIRYTHNAKVLAWLGNDALAKDDILAQAEGIRFAYSKWPQDLWGGIIPTGFLHARRYVDLHPGEGFFYGRGEAWGLDTMCAAFSMQDVAWRDATRPWFVDVADLIEDGQATCTGIIQSTPLQNVFNGMYRVRQSIETAITENALVGLRESVLAGWDAGLTARVNEVLRKSLYAMISPLVWSPAHNGPWAMMATGPYQLSQPPFCTYSPADGNYGFADTYQTWSSFAYAYAITSDPAFLDAAQAMLGQDIAAGLQNDATDNLQNRAALLALVQRIYLGL